MPEGLKSWIWVRGEAQHVREKRFWIKAASCALRKYLIDIPKEQI